MPDEGRSRARGAGVRARVLAAAALAGSAGCAAAQDIAVALHPGEAHTVELAPGRHGRHRIVVPAGHTAVLSIRQRDAMLQVRVHDGQGDAPPSSTQAGRAAMLRQVLIAQAASQWDVDVAAAKPERPASYRIEVGEAHPTRTADRVGAAGERAYAEAEALRRAAGGVEAGRGSADPDAARKAYRTAAALWTRVADACAALRADSGLARLELAQARYRQAQAAAQSALARGCDGSDLALEAERAVALRTLAAALGYQGEFEASAQYSERALAAYRRTGDRRFEGVVLGNLSAVYRSLGELQKASQAATDALRIAEQTGDAQGIGFSRDNLASAHLARGEFGRALAIYRQALDDLRRTPHALTEGLVWNELGTLYRRLGEGDDARSAWAHAREVWAASGNRSGLAETWIAEAEAALDDGRAATAAAGFSRALGIARADGLRSLQAQALRGLGRAATAAGDAPSARRFLHDAAALAAALRETALQVAADQSLGDLEAAERRWPPARARYRAALAGARRSGDASAEAAAAASLARADAATGRLGAAQAAIASALAIVETQRAAIADPGLRTGFFASQHAYYALAIDVEMALDRRFPRRGHAARALETAERARARSLLDLLAERSIAIDAEVDPALLAAERLAADRQRRLAWRLTHAPRADAGRLRGDLAAATRELDAARGRLRSADPRYAALAHPVPLSVDAARTQLLDADSAILEYWLGEAQSYLWVLRPEGLEAYRLPPRAEIASAVQALLEAATAPLHADATVPIERRAALDAAASAATRQRALALAALVLAPERRARWPRQLAIVADAELQRVPFALLAEAAGDEDAPAPALLPSIAALRSLRERPGAAAPCDAAAILADPVFAPDDPRLHGRAGAPDAGGGRLPRLAMARDEAQAVARLAAPDRSWLALGFAANRDAVLHARWSDYAIAHFATHALVDARRPELSGIVLSLYDEAGRAQDGYLRADDLYALRMPVELVVLGACESAQGADLPGEGVQSLARAFFHAGARRVVASLWPVDDRAGAAFMQAFYRGLLQANLRPPQALARAQAELRHNPRFAAAYYWGGFVLQGEWR